MLGDLIRVLETIIGNEDKCGVLQKLLYSWKDEIEIFSLVNHFSCQLMNHESSDFFLSIHLNNSIYPKFLVMT